VAEARDLLTTLLRDVSRSFYLSLWLLPSAVRRPIALGYLLARATDTVADTTLLPVSRRLAALGTLRGRIQGEIQQAVDLSEWAVDQNADATAGERVLLARVEEAVTVLGTLGPARRALRHLGQDGPRQVALFLPRKMGSACARRKV
jgi:farnesyl-diphosphate farnesyltransferase